MLAQDWALLWIFRDRCIIKSRKLSSTCNCMCRQAQVFAFAGVCMNQCDNSGKICQILVRLQSLVC